VILPNSINLKTEAAGFPAAFFIKAIIGYNQNNYLSLK